MTTPNLIRRSFPLFLAVASALLFAGCVSMTLSTPMLINALSYPVAPAKARVEATVVMKVGFTLTPDVRQVWRSSMVNDETIANYEQAVATVIGNDVSASGIFTNLVASAPSPDFVFTISSELVAKPAAVLRIHYDLVNGSGQRVNARTLEVALPEGVRNANLKERLPGAMRMVKDSVVNDIVTYYRARRDAKEREQMASIRSADFENLLASSDSSVDVARERNRALISAKNEQLPAMLREWKTERLAALVVKVEQTILDLNHEAEVANDHAQQAAAAGSQGAQVDAQRGLAISYRERIELLKPILAALREEIANRGR